MVKEISFFLGSDQSMPAPIVAQITATRHSIADHGENQFPEERNTVEYDGEDDSPDD